MLEERDIIVQHHLRSARQSDSHYFFIFTIIHSPMGAFLFSSFQTHQSRCTSGEQREVRWYLPKVVTEISTQMCFDG